MIPRAEFDKRNPFIGFARLNEERPDLGEYLAGSPMKLARFMPKTEAETDEAWLQIIPYITLICNDSVFTYRRSPKGGEARLHGLLSIGVGGHVNQDDDPDEPFFAFLQGARRELREELGLDLPHEVFKQCAEGLIFNPENAVGRVHLGVSLILNLTEALAEKAMNDCSIELLQPEWKPIQDFRHLEDDELETWSRHVIDYILRESSQDGKWSDKAFRERVNMLAVCAANLASSAAGFLMSDNQRGHDVAKAMVEDSAGQTQAMLAGLCYNHDIEQHKVKKAGQAFQSELPNILKHQA